MIYILAGLSSSNPYWPLLQIGLLCNLRPHVSPRSIARQQITNIVVDGKAVGLDDLPAERAGGPLMKNIQALLADSVVHLANNDRHVPLPIVGNKTDVALTHAAPEMFLDASSHDNLIRMLKNKWHWKYHKGRLFFDMNYIYLTSLKFILDNNKWTPSNPDSLLPPLSMKIQFALVSVPKCLMKDTNPIQMKLCLQWFSSSRTIWKAIKKSTIFTSFSVPYTLTKITIK